jgi:molybdate transport system substrate-binding protein
MRSIAHTTAATIAVMLLVGWTLASQAAEIRVISLPAYKSLLENLNPTFASKAGHTLAVEYGLFPQLKGRLDAGDFDVAISSGVMTDYLATQGKTIPNTRIVFSRVGIGVGVATGATKPDISSTAAFKRALLNATSISIPPKESTAGGYLIGLMERLGIADDVKSKLTITGGGGQTPRAIAAREADLGITLITEFVHVRGIDVVGPLPSELQHYVIQTGAVGTTAKAPEAAEALIKYLTTPAAAALIEAEGLEPLVSR